MFNDKELSVISISPTEISVAPSVVARLLHLPEGDIPEPYEEMIKNEISQIINYKEIAGGYRIIEDPVFDLENYTLTLEGELFQTGKQVIHYIRKAEKIALFACTAGPEVSRRSHDLIKSGDLLEGYICDIIGSLLVEEAMSLIHNRLIENLKSEGQKSTNRYSPGYCDWNVAEQHKLFKFFPEDFCGIRLSPTALMDPIKSVSGIFGMGKNVRFHKYVCNACSNVSCIYRNLKYA